MQYIRINKLSPKKLYRQLSESIEEAIIKKELIDGDKLPSEREITKVFGVSAKVVRRAYEELSKKGLIDGVSGKGTFVNNRLQVRAPISVVPTMGTWLNQQGYEVRIATTLVNILPEVPRSLSPLATLSLEPYLEIRRVYRVNQFPFLSRLILIPMSNVISTKEVSMMKLDCLSLIQAITARSLHTVESKILVYNAIGTEADFLNLTSDDAIQFYLSSIYDTSGQPVAIMHSYFNGKYAEFRIAGEDQLYV